ncbi:MAG: hypothetical protein ACR2HR_06660 [Euzebya sp.]
MSDDERDVYAFPLVGATADEARIGRDRLDHREREAASPGRYGRLVEAPTGGHPQANTWSRPCPVTQPVVLEVNWQPLTGRSAAIAMDRLTVLLVGDAAPSFEVTKEATPPDEDGAAKSNGHRRG